MFSRSGLRTQSLLGAVYQRLFFGVREFGRRMQRKIEPGRHIAFFHFLGDVFGVLLGQVPRRKIHMATATIHVSLDQPGYRSDVGIPAPPGFVAMAVKAGPAEQFPRLRGIPCWLLCRRGIRVGVAERNKLNQRGGKQHPLGDPHRLIMPYSADGRSASKSNGSTTTYSTILSFARGGP